METKTEARAPSHLALRALAEGAIMVAAAQVLSYIRIWEMPYGGNISLAMLPLLFYALRWGIKDGLAVGLVFGIIHFIFDGGIALGWQSIIGDYLVAFLVLGLAGLGHRKAGGVVWGSLIACAARFLVHFVVGATVWASYMPDTYLGFIMTNPWFYSLLYNGLYMLPSSAACIAVLAILSKPLHKFLYAEDLRP